MSLYKNKITYRLKNDKTLIFNIFNKEINIEKVKKQKKKQKNRNFTSSIH